MRISVSEGLRLVALNTQYADLYNFYLLLRENQGEAQIAFLENVLTNAVLNNEKVEYLVLCNLQVIIVGHIPSGQTAAKDYCPFGKDYVELAARFSDIIMGQFFGYLGP
jgi:hypothetical protein